MFTKYHINYEKQKPYLMIGGMDNNLVPNFVNEINTIYSHIKNLYSHGDIIVLTGSGALLYYLYILGYTDLINLLVEPNDVDFLLLTNESNATISVPFIGDHKRKQETHEKSATFENDWAPHLKFKSFDLTIPRSSITYNQVGKINLINLSQLKSYYQEDVDVRPADTQKIQIIDQIYSRLITNPKPETIGPDQIFRIIKNKKNQIAINYEDELNVPRVLFDDIPMTPEPKKVNTNLFNTPESKPRGKILFPDSP